MDAVERLGVERAATARRLAGLRETFAGVVDASRDSNADDEHDPEGQTIAYERSQTGALIRQAEQHLREIDAALDRVERGDYGRCESCGDAIGSGRLEARPTARTCIACASR